VESRAAFFAACAAPYTGPDFFFRFHSKYTSCIVLLSGNMHIQKDIPVFKDLENLFDFADRAVADVQKRYSKEVRCKKGCNDCCYAVFDVSLIEALYIRHHFDLLGRKQRRAALNIARPGII